MTYRNLTFNAARLAPVNQTRRFPLTRGEQNGFGDVTCWGVDTERWGKRNTAPLFNNRYNRWLVKVEGADALSEEQAINKVRSQFEGDLWTWFPSERGRPEGIIYSAWSSADQFENLNNWGETIRDAAWTADPAVTWEKGAPPVYVAVSFIYRGSLKELPWPVYRSGLGSFCPSMTQVALFRAYKPSDAEVPAEDPCSAPGAWWDNPVCKPFILSPSKWFSPSEWPWWAWLVVGGGILMVAGPIIVPLVGGAVRATTSAVGGVLGSATSGSKKSAKPNRRPRRRRIRRAASKRIA